MNPYNRFSLVSSSVTAALILAIIAVASPHILSLINQFQGSALEMGLICAGTVTVMVVFWMAVTEVILPTLFRLNWVRKLILGRYYIEGTWLQAEKSAHAAHVAVIDIQPNGKSFTFSGYALDENLNVNSNVLLELSRFDWPFLTYKYRNSLSDGADGQRDGVGEVQFEMNRSAARRYNGFSQYIKNHERVRLEGAKLVRNADVKRLRTLEGREEIVDQYWDLFFGREARRLQKQAKAQTAVPVKAADDFFRVGGVVAPTASGVQAVKAKEAEASEPLDLTDTVPVSDERRTGEAERPSDLEEHVIPRRRVSDWQEADLKKDEADAEADATTASAKPEEKSETSEGGVKTPVTRKGVFDARHVM